MDSGQIKLAELLQQVQPRESVSFRLALQRIRDSWQVHTLIIESFPDDEHSAPPFDYNYGSAHFISGAVSGSTATAWLSQREGRVQPPGTSGPVRTFNLQPIGETIIWNRYPSHSPSDPMPVPWPHTWYDASGYASQQTDIYDEAKFLLSNGCPFFPNFRAAVLELMYGVKDWFTPSTMDAGRKIVVRIAHTDAWLGQINLSPTAISVRINGRSITGARLVILAPPDVHFEKQFMGRATVKCPLSNALPSPLWIVLSRGNDWLDYYHRDDRWPPQRKLQANVTIDPGDVRNEVEAFIALGEGTETEFKRELSADRKRFLNTVSAFANTSGGTIVLGIDDERGTPGIATNAGELRDTITHLIRDNVTPTPEFNVTALERDSTPIIAVYIAQGTTHPCAVDPAKPRYYVRRGASNFPARPDEITQIVLARQPQVPIHYLNGGQ